MGILSSERFPEKYSAAYFRRWAERLKTAVNFIDERNFGQALIGSRIIKDKSLTLQALAQGEFYIPLVALAQAFTTTSAVDVNVSQLVYLSASAWKGCKAYLEVTGGGTGTNNHAVFTLQGASEALVTVTTNVTGYSWYRSEAFDIPATSQTVQLRMRSTVNGSSAGLFGASIVIIP